MALVKCVDCGTEISDRAAACIKCGAPIAARPPERDTSPPERNTPPPEPERGGISWWWLPVAGVAVFFGCGALLSNTPTATAKDQDRKVIEVCHRDQERKSLEPSTARFVAGVCERLEDEFRQKYGVSP